MPERYRILAGVPLVLLAALLGVGPAGAVGVSFGDVEVVPETEPRGAFLHGYVEYRFLVRNRNEDRAVRVTLQMPGDAGRGARSGALGSITKTVEVAAAGATSVSLLQPAAPEVGGGGVAVYLDGRKQDQVIPVTVVAGATPPAHVAHGRRGGRARYGYPKGGARTEVNLLTTLRVPEDFFQATTPFHFGSPRFGEAGMGAAPGMGAVPGMGGAPMPAGAPPIPGGPPGMGAPGGPAGGAGMRLPPPAIESFAPAARPPDWGDPIPYAERRPGPFDPDPAPPEDDPAPAGVFPGGLGVPGRAPAAGTGPRLPFDAQLQRADLPVTAWSNRWMAFTRFDGIFVTAEDLDDLQRAGTESRAIIQALWQYVETGGVLLVLGDGKGRVQVPVPAAYRHSPLEIHGLLVYPVGFGRCIVSPDRDRKKWAPRGADDALLSSLGWAVGGLPLGLAHGFAAAAHFQEAVTPTESRFADRWGVVQSAVSGTSIAYRGGRNFVDLNSKFPVVDDLGLPVKGLFALMVLFGLAMGPANLLWLTRLKRRIWLLWTVPALSLFFCLAVLGYMVVAEGWQGHARVGGVTILDEGERRATTLGRAAFYSPVTPGDGLHFSDTTEVQILGDESAAWTSTCSIDWTNDQHLARGWVTARVPAFFALRKSETLRRERLTLRREADGGLSVANALGVDITHLWLADEKGRLHRAASIAAGGSARLEDGGAQVAPAIPLQAWRDIYSNTDWLGVAKSLRDKPETFLGPGTYVAVVESSPFLEQGLRNAQVRPSESIILGVMADPAGRR